jgi:hypothetical protein
VRRDEAQVDVFFTNLNEQYDAPPSAGAIVFVLNLGSSSDSLREKRSSPVGNYLFRSVT